jgi:hypothetical protein
MRTFRRYVYNQPHSLPVTWDDDEMWRRWPATIRAGQDLTDDEWRAAGFEPDDEEAGFGALTDDWNGHKAGALVVSGLTVEGHPFAVEDAER